MLLHKHSKAPQSKSNLHAFILILLCSSKHFDNNDENRSDKYSPFLLTKSHKITQLSTQPSIGEIISIHISRIYRNRFSVLGFDLSY